MNRIIKFRVWSKYCSKYLSSEHGIFNNILKFTHDHVKLIDGCYRTLENDYVFQQFTGLFDKTGREIYEGDIIHYTNSREKIDFFANVTFSEKEAKYTIKSKMGEFSLVDRSDYYGTFVVVGNIFENPELLN